MSTPVAFILGLLGGWAVEWMIDWVYWRRRAQQLQASVDACYQTRASLEKELAVSRADARALQDKVGQLELEKGRLEILSVQAAEQATMRAQAAVPEPVIPDNLEEIKGIGKVIAGRLNEHGIYTFDQLAEQTPDCLRDMLGDVIQRLSDEESLIEQARQFALRKASKGAVPQ